MMQVDRLGNIEHWRAENRPEGPAVVSDADEPGTVMALCGRQQDAEQIARALNNSEGAVPVDVAVQALADALLSHDVPTGKVIVEFRRLVALYMADLYRRGQ